MPLGIRCTNSPRALGADDGVFGKPGGSGSSQESSVASYNLQAADCVALLSQCRCGVDACGRGIGVSVQVLDVGEVGADVSEPRHERVPNLIHCERLAVRLPRCGLNRLVGALCRPGTEGVGDDEVANS